VLVTTLAVTCQDGCVRRRAWHHSNLAKFLQAARVPREASGGSAFPSLCPDAGCGSGPVTHGPAVPRRRLTPASHMARVAAVTAVLSTGICLAGCQTALPEMPSSLATMIIPSGDGAVTGGIDACFGVPPKKKPGFVAGTVVVFGGSVTQVPVPGGDKYLLPSDMVMTRSVEAHQTYRFFLPPGKYVLVGHYAGSKIGDLQPWVGATVLAGKNLVQNISNECK